MHNGEMATAGEADARAKYRKLADTRNRKPGLLALRRAMDLLKKKLERVKKKRGSEDHASEQTKTVESVKSGISSTSLHGSSGPLDMSNQATVAISSSRDHDENGVAHQNGSVGPQTPQAFTPNSGMYYAPSSIDVDPALANDEKFRMDLEKLSKAFETRLAALRSAHELAQQKLIAEARLRNNVPMDVRNLMQKAAERSEREKENRKALDEAADVSVMKGVQPYRLRKASSKLSSSSGRQSPKLSSSSGRQSPISMG
jgi:hypothetical protein